MTSAYAYNDGNMGLLVVQILATNLEIIPGQDGIWNAETPHLATDMMIKEAPNNITCVRMSCYCTDRAGNQ